MTHLKENLVGEIECCLEDSIEKQNAPK